MNITTPHTSNRAHAYRDMYVQGVVEASFLWLLRSVAVNQPHYTSIDLGELEQRIDAQLNLLMTSMELGWGACDAALELQEPGEVFAATVTAMRSHEIPKIQKAVQVGLSNERTFKGLVSALGWLPAEIIRPWVERFLNGKDMNHKYLGVAACSIRREDPGELLTNILQREDCLKHVKLHSRALRLIGELRRQDLMPALQAAAGSSKADIAFWASWSSILLGQHAMVRNLHPLVLKRGPFQARAIQLVFRVLPVEQGREWISVMTKDPANIRAVVSATGILGDPHAVNWLISKMTDPLLARLAGESFSTITGVDLEKHQLHTQPPAGQSLIPNDDPTDPNVDLDEDENLPWPNVEKITELWRHHGANFLVGRRYFLGKAITPEWLKSRIADGTQRQRHAAALELALIDPQSRLINTRAKASI